MRYTLPMKRIILGSVLLAFSLSLSACAQAPGSVPLSSAMPKRQVPSRAHHALVNPQIQHVVIIVQENRSFNNLFMGFPGADTSSEGKRSDGQTVALMPVHLESGDIGHSHQNFLVSYDGGKMDGFDQETYDQPQHPLLPYSYVTPSEIQPYWQLAQQYVLGDQMFQSNSGPSFPAHQYLIAGESDDADGNPGGDVWGCDAPKSVRAPQMAPDGQQEKTGVFPCFSYQTLGDLLDAQHLTWRYYAPQAGAAGYIWSAYDAISQIRYGSDWTSDVESPETTILTDIANGQLANVTWVAPSASDSDHAGVNKGTGPDWVASVVNAVGKSPFWDTTAIFVVWDDWGGWYDNVAPRQLDVMGLGFRVPLIVVSPYAKQGYVSHQQHEFGSILKFTEETFGLPSLGTTDARADDLSDCFNFLQVPRSFTQIQARVRPNEFVRMPSDGIAPDDD
jgi:phospholipase C